LLTTFSQKTYFIRSNKSRGNSNPARGRDRNDNLIMDIRDIFEVWRKYCEDLYTEDETVVTNNQEDYEPQVMLEEIKTDKKASQ